MAKPHARGSTPRIISARPRGARMALNNYSDIEAVRSRGQDLVSTCDKLGSTHSNEDNIKSAPEEPGWP